MLRSYAGILLDMDGTLVDTERHWVDAVQIVARELGAVDGVDPAAIVGSSVPGIVSVLLAVTGSPVPAAELQRRLEAAVEEQIAEAGVQPRPGAHELLSFVQGAGLPCALVTSSDRARTEEVLDVLGREWFAATVTADDVERHKPDPLPYLTAAALLGVAAPDCLAIEDSLAGVLAAEAAGCTTIAVPQLQPIPATAGRLIVDSLYAVLAVAPLRS